MDGGTLNLTPGPEGARGVDINNAGQICGYSQGPATGFGAFIWDGQRLRVPGHRRPRVQLRQRHERPRARSSATPSPPAATRSTPGSTRPAPGSRCLTYRAGRQRDQQPGRRGGHDHLLRSRRALDLDAQAGTRDALRPVQLRRRRVSPVPAARDINDADRFCSTPTTTTRASIVPSCSRPSPTAPAPAASREAAAWATSLKRSCARQSGVYQGNGHPVRRLCTGRGVLSGERRLPLVRLGRELRSPRSARTRETIRAARW